MKQGRDFWAEIVAEYERGGAAVAAVAARYGVKPATLSWWIWRLRREDRARRRRSSTEMRLVPVEIDLASAAAGSGAHGVEVVVGDVLVRMISGTDPAYVAALVRELRAC